MSEISSFLKRIAYSWKYMGRPPWDTGIPAPELVSLVSNLRPERALDIGCGGGTNVCYLAEQGWLVTGIDFVPRAVSLAKRRLKQKGLTADIRVGDVSRLENMALQGPFQIAVDIGCFHSLAANPNDVSGYRRGLQRWLAEGGHYLLYAHDADPGRRIAHGVTREFVERTFGAEMDLQAYLPGREGSWHSAWYIFDKK